MRSQVLTAKHHPSPRPLHANTTHAPARGCSAPTRYRYGIYRMSIAAMRVCLTAAMILLRSINGLIACSRAVLGVAASKTGRPKVAVSRDYNGNCLQGQVSCRSLYFFSSLVRGRRRDAPNLGVERYAACWWTWSRAVNMKHKVRRQLYGGIMNNGPDISDFKRRLVATVID